MRDRLGLAFAQRRMQIRNSCKANDDVHGSFFLGTKHSSNNGFTLLELMVVLAIIGVMLAMLIPAVQSARESARRMRCQSNLKQTVLGLHNYHSAHDRLPMHGGGTRIEISRPLGSGGNELGNHFMLSFLVGLLPFIDQQVLWEQISHPMVSDQRFSTIGNMWPAMGPFPAEKVYRPWATNINTYQCPSQPEPLVRGGTNYAACLGDSIDQTEWGDWHYAGPTPLWRSDRLQRVNTSCRGLWVKRRFCRFASVQDGLSNTLILGEIRQNLGMHFITEEPALWNGETPGGTWTSATTCEKHIDPSRPRYWKPLTQTEPPNEGCRGASYALAIPTATSFNTINRPNGPVCLSMHIQSPGHLPPSSHHAGGVNVAMADGAIRFITDGIDTGNPQASSIYLSAVGPPESTASPYGVWGAMGTRESGDIIEGL